MKFRLVSMCLLNDSLWNSWVLWRMINDWWARKWTFNCKCSPTSICLIKKNLDWSLFMYKWNLNWFLCPSQMFSEAYDSPQGTQELCAHMMNDWRAASSFHALAYFRVNFHAVLHKIGPHTGTTYWFKFPNKYTSNMSRQDQSLPLGPLESQLAW